MRISGLGLGRIGSYEYVPASPGVSEADAQRACIAARGTWYPYIGVSAVGQCKISTGPDLPSWCDWMPFASSFDECKLPTADDLAQISSYTAYQIGQKPVAGCQPTYVNGQMIPPSPDCTTTGEEAAQQIMQTAQDQSDNEIASAGCNYAAAANYPALSQIFGPSGVRMLTNPFGSGCTDADGTVFPGWLLYAGLGLLGFMLLKNR